jgi:leader peptidase (prepilin peptidase)/N-methyltransferase
MVRVIVLVVLFGTGVGAAVGSYWGVVADRGWAGSISGRSRCDGCGRQLTWVDLVPVVSYLALRGRCRTCGARIPARLLLREVAAALVGAGVAVAIVALVGPLRG